MTASLRSEGEDRFCAEKPRAATAMPVRWTGAKRGSGVWQRIISLFPPHRVFVDAFAGTGHIARTKLPAPFTILADADPNAPALTMKARRVTVDEAGSLISNLGGALSAKVAAALMGRACDPIVLCGDARELLPALPLGPSDLVYCDPPYPASVRSTPRRYYRCELMTDHDHALLLAMLQALPCMVAVSGYHCPLYDLALADWSLEEIPTVTRGGKRSLECVWFNWPRSTAPADTRFVGENFRERERIKRKAARWRRMLAEMPPAERAAVLAALDEVRS